MRVEFVLHSVKLPHIVVGVVGGVEDQAERVFLDRHIRLKAVVGPVRIRVYVALSGPDAVDARPFAAYCGCKCLRLGQRALLAVLIFGLHLPVAEIVVAEQRAQALHLDIGVFAGFSPAGVMQVGSALHIRQGVGEDDAVSGLLFILIGVVDNPGE